MINIVKVTEETVSELGRVHALAWQSSHKGIVSEEFLYSFTPERQTKFFQDEMKDESKSFYLAYLDDRPIGMISLNICPDGEAEDVGEIISIYLLPEYQRNGYGKQMIDFGIDVLRQNKKQFTFLWMMNINQKAKNFYEKCGFAYSGCEKMLSVEKGISEMKYTISVK